MIDNFDCEETVIGQFVRLQLDHCLIDTKAQNIVRIPLQAFKFCRSIFKRQKLVFQYLFEFIHHVFYLSDLSVINQVSDDLATDMYRRLLVKCKSNRVIYLGQIHVRLVMLGLSIKLMNNDRLFFGKKMKFFIRQLQFELQFVFASQQSLSDLILKQLEELKLFFDEVQYFEHIRDAFTRLDVMRVVRWAQNILLQKRKQFEQKMQSIAPLTLINNKTGDKNDIAAKITRKRMSNRQKEFDPEEIRKSIQKQKKSQIKMQKQFRSKTVSKEDIVDRENKVKNQNRRISLVSQVNKIRRSMNAPCPRYSCKYTFKSTKKEVPDLVEYCQFTPPEDNPSKNEKISEKWHNNRKTCPPMRQQQQNSKFLCHATPPRPTRKTQDY